MHWLEVTYQPTTLFSLKPSWATSSGGKSLLLPTPYALKTAVLDAAIRTSGLAVAQAAWPWLRDMHIAIALPPQIVVTNLFSRILREKEIKVSGDKKEAAIVTAKDKQQWPFGSTIAYREYVYVPTPWRLAMGLEKAAHQALLAEWLCQISYLGKRGGLVQLMAPPVKRDDDAGFIRLTAVPDDIPAQGLIQPLDDCGPKMTFAHANIYDKKAPDRVVRHIVLPYRLTKSSKSYSLYEQI